MLLVSWYNSAKCIQIIDADSGIYLNQNTKCKLPDTKCRIQNTKHDAVECMQIIDAVSGKRLNQNCPINTQHRPWPDSNHVTN